MYTQSYKPTTQTTTKPRIPAPHAHNLMRRSAQKQKQQLNIKSSSYSRENSPQYQQNYQSNEYNQQIKAENTKLKKLLKEAQAKRIQITKECSELAGKYDRLEEENMQLHRKVKEWKDVGDGEKFRYEELKFLNKELNAQIQQLHAENKNLNDRLKHQTDILEKKYEQLEERTYKRIEQALKRIKKAIHYLSSLSTKQIQKTKEIQIQNLTKAAQVLRGKYNESNKFEQQIQQLMNPIRNIQQDLHQKTKQITLLKQQNNRLQNQVRKHKKVQKQLLPQYKEAVQKLKKNLGQVRLQLSQNQYDKLQIKRKYEQKIKQTQMKYEELFKQHRKIKLQNKIFQKKMEQMEDDVEEEKQRLIGENQLLKKLYKSQDVEKSRRSLDKELGLDGYMEYQNNGEDQLDRHGNMEVMSYKTANQFRKPVQQYINIGRQNQQRQESKKKGERDRKPNHIKKNYSASHLHASLENQQKTNKQKKPLKLRESPLPPPTNQTPISQSRQSESKRKNYDHLRHQKQKKDVEISDYYHHDQNNGEGESSGHHEEESGYREEGSSVISVSQDGLKNQIFKIDQEIMEIQKTLDKELNMYK